MSAQELYKIIQKFLLGEKMVVESFERMKGHNDYLLGRWASLVELENLLDKLDPEIFPDLGEDER